MIEREKVIKGLECCLSGPMKCDNCPYKEDDGTTVPICVKTLRNEAVELLKKSSTVNRWISIDERMPAETHSMFWRFSGTDKWSNAMWREQSDKVLVTVAFKDGSRLVTTGETHDGKWNTGISRTLEHTVTHWMPMPDLPPEHMT